MKLMQASFSSGEISPLLHARVDLARYLTGLADLQNMVVLPQGGVTRRPGFEYSAGVSGKIYLIIPFEFNSTDTALIVFIEHYMKIYGNVSGSLTLLATLNIPYDTGDLEAGIDYVQSGNVVFLANKNVCPYVLRRKSLKDWTLTKFDFRGGPFIDSTEWGAKRPLTLKKIAGTYYQVTSTEDIFNYENLGSGMLNTLMKLEYPVKARSETLAGSNIVNFEVKGTLNVVTTGGDWKGKITIDRSSDGGVTWVTVRVYNRINPDSQGQWDFTVSEEEEYILYRVTTAKTDGGDLSAVINSSGFLKSAIYRISGVRSTKTADLIRIKEFENGNIYDSVEGLEGDKTVSVTLWAMGSWGGYQGYPQAVSMYQDRLVFAATKMQPQTIWMSRTGSYTDFSISSTLKDDDAVTITLAGSSADRIHHIAVTTDLLAFSNSGEWKIRGAGDSGAITPSALTAHQQTNIGSKNIKPIVADGRVIMVQAQGEKIYTLGYDLNTDGYTGSELTILSSHIFEGKQIISIAYQRTPDSLIWVLLNDGTFASCTFNPEHEVIGWARHFSNYAYYGFNKFAAIAGSSQTELFAAVNSSSLLRLKARRANNHTDSGVNFESLIRTLRININSESGSLFTNKKLISRVIVSTIKSGSVWAAPGGLNDKNNWERRRKINCDNQAYLTDSEIQLDNGFDEYASVQIRSIDAQPLTIAAITPAVTVGS